MGELKLKVIENLKDEIYTHLLNFMFPIDINLEILPNGNSIDFYTI